MIWHLHILLNDDHRKFSNHLWKWKWSRSVMSDSLRPHGLQPKRLLCSRDFPGKNTGVGCHFLLQEIFPIRDQTQVSRIADRLFTVWATREVICPYTKLLQYIGHVPYTIYYIPIVYLWLEICISKSPSPILSLPLPPPSPVCPCIYMSIFIHSVFAFLDSTHSEIIWKWSFPL